MWHSNLYREHIYIIQGQNSRRIREPILAKCATHYVDGGESTNSCKIPLHESKWILARCRKILPLILK